MCQLSKYQLWPWARQQLFIPLTTNFVQVSTKMNTFFSFFFRKEASRSWRKEISRKIFNFLPEITEKLGKNGEIERKIYHRWGIFQISEKKKFAFSIKTVSLYRSFCLTELDSQRANKQSKKQHYRSVWRAYSDISGRSNFYCVSGEEMGKFSREIEHFCENCGFCRRKFVKVDFFTINIFNLET